MEPTRYVIDGRTYLAADPALQDAFARIYASAWHNPSQNARHRHHTSKGRQRGQERHSDEAGSGTSDGMPARSSQIVLGRNPPSRWKRRCDGCANAP